MSSDDIEPVVYATVDFELVRIVLERPSETASTTEFLVKPQQWEKRLSVERLNTTGRTVDPPGGNGGAPTRWLAKIYRPGSPADARELRKLLDRQTKAIQQVNSAPHDDVTQWAVAPAYLAHTVDPSGAAPRTRLGVGGEPNPGPTAAHQIAAWFPTGKAQPHWCLVVVSRELPGRMLAPFVRIPAIESLPALGRIADGLTRLHQSGFAHCDVAPSNLRKDPRGQLVLVDLDSIVGLSDQPTYIGAQYCHPEVALRQANNATVPMGGQQTGITTGELVAQDWYGLVITVLGELAGAQWVASKFGSFDGQLPPAPDAADIETDLMRLWRADDQWRPLARAAATPFQQLRAAALLDPKWSSAAWLDQLRAAAAEREVKTPPPTPEVDVPFAAELRDFRNRVQGPVAVKTEGRDRVVAVTREMSHEISWRVAGWWIRSAITILVLVYAVALFVAIGGIVR